MKKLFVLSLLIFSVIFAAFGFAHPELRLFPETYTVHGEQAEIGQLYFLFWGDSAEISGSVVSQSVIDGVYFVLFNEEGMDIEADCIIKPAYTNKHLSSSLTTYNFKCEFVAEEPESMYNSYDIYIGASDFDGNWDFEYLGIYYIN